MIFITGATGFIGRATAQKLSDTHKLRLAVRNKSLDIWPSITEFVEASLSPHHDWHIALLGVSTVVHCAARVHVMKNKSADKFTEYGQVNFKGTLNLARQAAEAGVVRFIFISSIKVNGESTEPNNQFTAGDIPHPQDPYGVSKYEAELGLIALSEETGMEVVIIRSPLVYGPGVKANFLTMMNLLWRGLPLPFGGVTKNRRSLVFLDNLVDLIATCVDHPAAANQTFLVSDGEDLSTAALLQLMASALGKPAKLIAVPAFLISLGANLVGRADIAQRLCGSLQVDIKKTRELLDWSPPVSMHEGLRQTASYFLKNQS